MAQTPSPEEAEREAKRRAIAEARADVAAGRVIPHADMTKWLESWGTPDELPPPSTWK
jgi:predicted transcriptional regulator